MVRADTLKASVVEQNKKAAEIPYAIVELDCAGCLVAAYQDDKLLAKKEALKLAELVSGEGERVTKTFKDYEGRVEYGTLIKFKVPTI